MSGTNKFIDRAKVYAKAGDGGHGSLSFRREKYLPKGGPDGGDGGRGGNVIFVGSQHLGTLLDFQYRKHFRAKGGESGSGSQCTGRAGEDLVVDIPLGTLIIDDDTGETLGEVTRNHETLIVARGGKGGLGNLHFASSTNRAPRQTTPGATGEEKWLRLELRLLADIGIVGPPNAGKSTLLTKLTSARPKIGDYPFTTLHPSLGVMKSGDQTITLADIPGLIEGAHEGVGLGIDFLRHIRRTRALIYLVPGNADEPTKPFEEFQTTLSEIESYDPSLAKLKRIIVLNKRDLLTDVEIKANLKPFKRKRLTPLVISAKSEEGLTSLRKEIVKLV